MERTLNEGLRAALRGVGRASPHPTYGGRLGWGFVGRLVGLVRWTLRVVGLASPHPTYGGRLGGGFVGPLGGLVRWRCAGSGGLRHTQPTRAPGNRRCDRRLMGGRADCPQSAVDWGEVEQLMESSIESSHWRCGYLSSALFLGANEEW